MKNAWKILAGCGCLSLLAGALLLGAWFFLDRKPKPELEHYSNSSYGRTGKLQEHYTDFSFDYPKTWTIKTVDPDNINYVTVERSVDNKTWENFNVSYYTPASSTEQNEQLFQQLFAQVEEQYQQQAHDFHKVYEGLDAAGHYPGHEALFTGTMETKDGPVQIYSRIIFVARPGGGHGVSITMMGTSFCPDLHEANDLGRKGELPIVLDSFRFGD